MTQTGRVSRRSTDVFSDLGFTHAEAQNLRICLAMMRSPIDFVGRELVWRTLFARRAGLKVGFTGAPGAAKLSLVDRLAGELRREGKGRLRGARRSMMYFPSSNVAFATLHSGRWRE